MEAPKYEMIPKIVGQIVEVANIEGQEHIMCGIVALESTTKS